MILEQILRQCGNDLSRDFLKQAKRLTNLRLPTAMPGIAINTTDQVNMVWTQMRLQRWTGSSWEQFGDVLDSLSD